MTATLTRWWAPEATLPFQQLLTVGADPRKDMTNALFALHRAGAEACELVAKTAVADEAVLIAALAETRLLVVPQALGVVSKGVESVQYAGLLLRDVLDDAEASALALYRTCLAKNISPPVAAQRVGAVYGVPGRELGKYASVAADPAAKEVAVRDAADRALFGYVSKLVEAEYTGPTEQKVEISKAPGPQRAERVSDYLDQQNVVNDPETGQFVAEQPAGATRARMTRTSAVGSRLSRTATSSRQARTARTARTAAPRLSERVQAGMSERVQAAARQRTHVTMSRVSAPMTRLSAPQQERARTRLSRTAVEMQRHTLEVEEKAPKAMGLDEVVPDVIGRRKDPNVSEHAKLEHDLGFVMPSRSWSLLSQAGAAYAEGDMLNLMVAGALVEYAGTPEVFSDGQTDTGDPVIHEHHEAQAGQAALLVKGALQNEPKLFIRALPSGWTKDMTKQAFDLFIKHEKEDLLREYGVKNDIPMHTGMEIGYVHEVPNYADPDQWLLVYTPKPEVAVSAKRPTPNITEVRIPQGQARGHDQGFGQQTDIEVEKNQGLTVNTVDRYFDGALGVFRTRVTMKAVDNDTLERARNRVGKAMSARQFQENVTEGDIARDESGRFAATEERPVAQRVRAERTRAAAPLQRTQARTARTARVSRQTQAVQQRTQLAQSARTQAPSSRTQATTDRAQATRSRTRTDVLRTATERSRARAGDAPDKTFGVIELKDDFKYAVLDDESLKLYAQRDNELNPGQQDKPWALGYQNHTDLLKHHLMEDGGEAAWTIRDQAEPDADPNDFSGRHGVSPLAQVSIRNTKDLWKLESVIHKAMDTTPGQKVLTLHMHHAGGDVTAEVIAEVIVHNRGVPPQHLVRWDVKKVGDRPVQLIPEGEYHLLSKVFVRNWLEVAYESALDLGWSAEYLASPKVNVWRMQEQP